MVTSPVAYDALVETREKMLGILQQTLTEKEKRFLLSLKIGQPEWALMAIDGIDKLPALQWKWMNIQRMSTHKRAEALKNCKRCLVYKGLSIEAKAHELVTNGVSLRSNI